MYTYFWGGRGGRGWGGERITFLFLFYYLLRVIREISSAMARPTHGDATQGSSHEDSLRWIATLKAAINNTPPDDSDPLLAEALKLEDTFYYVSRIYLPFTLAPVYFLVLPREEGRLVVTPKYCSLTPWCGAFQRPQPSLFAVFPFISVCLVRLFNASTVTIEDITFLQKVFDRLLSYPASSAMTSSLSFGHYGR